MGWRTLSIRSRMFFVISLLLLTGAVAFIAEQSMTTMESKLTELKTEILPLQLQKLASQVSLEIQPSIIASELMTNDQFISFSAKYSI